MKRKILFILFFIPFISFALEKIDTAIQLAKIEDGTLFTFNGSLIRKAKKVCDKSGMQSSFVNGKLKCVSNQLSLIERRFNLKGSPPNKAKLQCKLFGKTYESGGHLKLTFDSSCNFMTITISRAHLESFIFKTKAGEIEASSFNYNLGSFGEIILETKFNPPQNVIDSERDKTSNKNQLENNESLSSPQINKK